MAEELAEKAEGASGESPDETPQSLQDLEPKMKVRGKVDRLELYGAFVDIGLDANAILHISKLGRKVNRINDALSVGDEIEAFVESVSPEAGQVTLTMKAPLAVDWSDLKEGQRYTGTVTRLEKFGAFVDIGADKEGLVHISELSHDYVNHPSEVVKVGDEIEVRVLGFSKRKRRIDLSRKATLETAEATPTEVAEVQEEAQEEIEMPTAMEIALRRAMGESLEDIKEQSRGRRTRSRNRARREQEDILSRTLKLTQESGE